MTVTENCHIYFLLLLNKLRSFLFERRPSAEGKQIKVKKKSVKQIQR